MKCAFRALIAMAAALLPTLAFGQAFGIGARVPNTTLLIDDLPAPAPGAMQLQRAFPRLSFSQPVLMVEIPDGSGRLAVVEKTGRIKVFPRSADPAPGDVSVFLDLSGKVATSSEQGLLGLAFDPDYATNGVFYVDYSWNGESPSASRVARFTNANPAANSADPGSEEVLLQVHQPYANHDGGMIAFGPDGMLYVGFGDGGSGGDPQGNGQNTATLLGSILRIDVRGTPDAGLGYRIPVDNPFYAGGPAGAATRKEIWAYGLRNPWRFSFDRQRGMLFCGDVGQNQYEEIDLIRKGGNYGWNRMEGLHCYNPASGCDQSGITLPIVEYDHSFGSSVTGGYVYYGSAVPELYGTYLYSDYGSGTVWGLKTDGTTVEGPYTLVSGSGRNLAGFGQTADGDVYLIDVGGGGIYELRPAAPAASTFPTRLSDIPALLAAGLGQDQTAQGIYPYAPSAKLWSDGALKQRFIALPASAQITWTAAGGWNFPEKTVLIKNFLMPSDERNPAATARRIETRLLYRRGGQWHGFTYEWNDAQTDAELLVGGKYRILSLTNRDGQPETFDYLIPSRNQCQVCHTEAAGGVLGLNTPQMNTDFAYPESGVTDNQLRAFDHIGLFTTALPGAPATLPAMPDPQDTGATLNARARAYLAANCAMCHQPGGTAPTDLDLRWEVTNTQMHAIGVAPGNGDLGLVAPRVIKPGDPDNSVLLARMAMRDGQNQMPRLATARVDQDAVALVRAWIQSNSVPVTLGRFTIE